MARRRSYRNEERRASRRSEERRFEGIIFAAIVLLFLFAIFYGISAANMSLLGGAILVGSGVYQTQQRWRVNTVTWIGGAILVLVGLMGYQGQPVPGGMMLPFVILGGVVAASFIRGDL
jgi:hypothetical protein